jgi:Na+/H+-dicarboxylate symporter
VVPKLRVSDAARILAALGAGLTLGTLGAAADWPLGQPVAVAGVIGGIWLDGLKMTVVPLVFALIVTGIASAAATAGAGGATRRALWLFVGLLLVSALVGATLGSALLGVWSPPEGALQALRTERGGGALPDLPPVAEWFRTLVPTNVVSAAAEGAIVPLTIFALFFGLAAARLPHGQSRSLLGFFEAVAQAMLMIVRWVLLLAPIGVFALSFSMGARLGLGAAAALAHYVSVQIAVTLVLGLAMYPLATLAGRIRLGSFARAALPAQAVAASSQSSLASLPPMLAGAERLNVSTSTASVVLPLAVALFRLAAPASIVIVTLAMARMSGVEIGPAQIAIAACLASINTLVIAGLPNQVTFFAAYAPPALAAGVPIELLPLLLAVDTIPDIFYTVTNVTADLAVTSVAEQAGTVGQEAVVADRVGTAAQPGTS